MPSAREIARKFRAAKGALRREMMRAERQNARDAHETILGYFSGPFSTAALRKMYNPRGPYSAADPHPPAPAEFINVQTGALREQWQQEGPAWDGDRIVTTFTNTDPIADWQEKGTRKMMPRHYIEAIENDLAPRLERRRDDALRKVTKDL